MGFAQVWLGGGSTFATGNFPHAAGLRGAIAQLCQQASDGIWAGFIGLFILVALRFLVRRGWIAYVLGVPLAMFLNELSIPTSLPILDGVVRFLLAVLVVLVGVRFGLFALATFVATWYFLNLVPLTNELSAWYADQTIFAGFVIVGLALVAARFAVGKRVLLP